MTDPVTFDVACGTLQWEGGNIQLSRQQTEVLRAIVRHGPVASRSAVEAAVWMDAPPSGNALTVHVHKLRKKLRKAQAPVSIARLYGVGFVLGGDVRIVNGCRTLTLDAAAERVLRQLIRVCPDPRLASRAYALTGIA